MPFSTTNSSNFDFSRPLRASALALVLLLGACVAKPLTEKEACPCAPNWTCVNGACAPNAAPLADAGPDLVSTADGAGSPDASGPPPDTDASTPPASPDGALAADAFPKSPDDAHPSCRRNNSGSILAFDPTAACAAATTATKVPFTNANELAALLVGGWMRCEGPLQPNGGPVAPDGQDGLELNLFPGTQQGPVRGMRPNGGPCFDHLLLYVGGGKFDVSMSWAFSATPTGPGLVFQGADSLVVYDHPAFSNGGKRMILTDPLWFGTYVKGP